MTKPTPKDYFTSMWRLYGEGLFLTSATAALVGFVFTFTAVIVSKPAIAIWILGLGGLVLGVPAIAIIGHRLYKYLEDCWWSIRNEAVHRAEERAEKES